MGALNHPHSKKEPVMTEQEFVKFLENLPMGELLLKGQASLAIKEDILLILAHHRGEYAVKILEEYARHPDEGLKYFSEFALEECRWWNE